MRSETIYEVGDLVLVKDLMFDNDMGGTEILDGANMTARMTKTFHDYETGQVCHGLLVKPEEVARLKKLGTTGSAGKYPSHFDERGTVWNPAKVYFYMDKITGPGQAEAPAQAVEPGSKRPDAMIIADLRRVDNALSPENLTCDGELSKSQVATRLRGLKAEQKKLTKELGRCPTDTELSGS